MKTKQEEWTLPFVIAEINRLAHIKQQRTLTESEHAYREQLKVFYLRHVRMGVEQQLNSLRFVDEQPTTKESNEKQ